MIAHILSNLPLPLQWGLALLIFGGALAVFAVRRSAIRIAGAVAAFCGIGGLVASWILSPALLVPAPYAVRIVSPAPGAEVGSPFILTVCGVPATGPMVPATDSQHYLAIIIDGVQAPTVDVWQVPQDLSPGSHVVEVELVSPSHQAFSPPATAKETITVVAGKHPTGPVVC
ncbi:MAG TPA: hypothetical protein VI434_05830 [Candidatus Dormibacteraeota bacterium]